MLDPPGPPRAQVLKRIYSVQTPKAHTELKRGKKQDEKEKVIPVSLAEERDDLDNETVSPVDLENIAQRDHTLRSGVHERIETPNKSSTCEQKNTVENEASQEGDKIDADPIAVISRYENS